jgi:zinc transporter, ZIP family
MTSGACRGLGSRRTADRPTIGASSVGRTGGHGRRTCWHPSHLLLPPGEVIRAHIEHLAAGVLLAVIAFSVSYEIRHLEHIPAAVGGLIAGAAFMVAMKTYLRRFETPEDDPSPVGFVTAAGIDTFIDGVLIGAAFSVRPELAVLVLIGLSIELFVLNMSVASELLALKMKRWKVFTTATLIALALAVGAGLGTLIMRDAGPAAQTTALAFALAALLYLVAEELLLRGNDTENSPTTTAAFFGGVIALAGYIMFSEG